MTPALAPTPLLLRQQPVPAPTDKRSRRIAQIIGGAIGIAIVILGEMGLDGFDIGTAFLTFVVALFIGILIHELGHLVAGKWAGFEFHQILVGPWMVTREARGLKLRFLPKRILASSGHTGMLPRDGGNLRRSFEIFVAGGPVATALCFLPLAVVPIGSVWWGVLVANLVIALFSWTPMTIAGQRTDGKHLWILAQGGPSAESYVALLYLLALDARGTNPRDWPPAIVDRLSAETAGGESPEQAVTLLYIYAADGGDVAAMADALERVLSKFGRMPAAMRLTYMAEAARFLGFYRKDAVKAAEWLAEARKVKGAVTTKDWDASALAAIAFAEGNYDEARKQLHRAIARLDKMSLTIGSVLAARRRLTAILESLPEM